MGIQAIEDSKKLRANGKRLGRAGMSERVIKLVDEFTQNKSYKNAIMLAGKLKAIATAAKCDSYWDEKCSAGFRSEFDDLDSVLVTGELPDGRKSRWIE